MITYTARGLLSRAFHKIYLYPPSERVPEVYLQAGLADLNDTLTEWRLVPTLRLDERPLTSLESNIYIDDAYGATLVAAVAEKLAVGYPNAVVSPLLAKQIMEGRRLIEIDNYCAPYAEATDAGIMTYWKD